MTGRLTVVEKRREPLWLPASARDPEPAPYPDLKIERR